MPASEAAAVSGSTTSVGLDAKTAVLEVVFASGQDIFDPSETAQVAQDLNPGKQLHVGCVARYLPTEEGSGGGLEAGLRLRTINIGRAVKWNPELAPWYSISDDIGHIDR
ncbi:conserved hypothetical protein [Histoplasma mississippiense (nom. inval.)]|uniref:conserved hypothetical protein n=1 Tax=Ajellomyces capsulatus (strain NAm1 / WU24) TaxID=2059318 RepID=UPI000157C458|nr:conserved hypothetical protein [Histoplasma mississippiense (nom. inval.)]EDN08907.1 conserved hypothetical protein [Histoplasma mississippiense (nom. inval.)]